MGMNTFKQEIVSGGTQKPLAADEQPKTLNPILGIGVWVVMFAAIYYYSPWAFVFAVALAVSIIAHEFGHYWTARKSGMKATQFFLGFGPRIWSTQRNGVEYGVRVIPAGGFVKIIGMTNVDEVDPADEPYTYRQGTYARRMWVITAGSVMHLLIAFAIIVPVYAFAGQVRNTDRVELWTVMAGTPAADAGLQTGDVVTSLDGQRVTSAKDFRSRLGAHAPGDSVALDIDRDGTLLSFTVVLDQHPEFTEPKGYLGVSSSDEDRVALGVGEALLQGPRDLFVGLGQAVVGVAKVINPVNVWGHLMGTNDDFTSRPGTIVGATQLSDDVGTFDGWAGILSLIATVNLSVGVFNMFPLLPLDGGHAAIATYERVRSRKGRRYYADVNKLTPVAVMCLALIAFMFLTGLYLDAVK